MTNKTHKRRGGRSGSSRSRRSRSNRSTKYLKKGLSAVQTTTKKYMPKVRYGLEKVGAKMTDTAAKSVDKSVPMIEKKARELLGMLGFNKTQNKRNKRVSFLII